MTPIFTRFRPVFAALATFLLLAAPAASSDRGALVAKANAALDSLYATQPASKEIAAKAAGVLIFPEILKGGVIIGAAAGDGVLKVGGKTAGYYRSVAGSIGYQLGLSKFGYAMMFMSQNALNYLESSDGWEVGVGPAVIIADEGVQGRVSNLTQQDGVVVFFFDQKGFFAGGGIEGSKISRQ